MRRLRPLGVALTAAGLLVIAAIGLPLKPSSATLHVHGPPAHAPPRVAVEEGFPVEPTTSPQTTTTEPLARENVDHVERARASRAVPSSTPGPSAGPASGCQRHGAKTYAEMVGCWAGLVGRYPWPVGQVFNVMYCESHGDPWARNPSSATGLMQVLGGPTDPAANIALAYQMWSARGWRPWVCRP